MVSKLRMNLPSWPLEPLNQLTQHMCTRGSGLVLRGGGTLSRSKGVYTVQIGEFIHRIHCFQWFHSLCFAAWSWTNERTEWACMRSFPLTIIYEAVCFLKFTRCCLLASLVQRITECFIQYLSKTADVTYKWSQIRLQKKDGRYQNANYSLGRLWDI